jgi:hypothetical protein
LVGVAVKITFDPEQLVLPVLLEILTAVGMDDPTVIVTLLLEAEDVVTQLNEEVNVHVMTSPLLSEEVVYVLLPDPTGEPCF